MTVTDAGGKVTELRSSRSIFLSAGAIYTLSASISAEVPKELCFTAEEDGATVGLYKNAIQNPVNQEYSRDGINWSEYEFDTDITLGVRYTIGE